LKKEVSDLKEKVQDLNKEVIDLKLEVKDLNTKVEILQPKVDELSSKVKETTLDEDMFRENDKLVLYYTGLSSWKLLLVLFTYIHCHLKQRSSLSPFQQLILTLMKMRLNLPRQDLAYRFGIHNSTVTRTFHYVIDVLYVMLKPLIVWPERETLLKTMPMDFRKYCPRCVVIIDCFEIFLERPTNLLARAQTFSSYKHHNTIKYLIGITPQGTVTYISEGWGGRTSDKRITEECGILNKLLPGDTILADREFDIREAVGLYYATIKMPAFTKGKNQLSGIDVEQTRQIANIRIHVERVIGNLRQKFSLLSSTIPIDLVRDEEVTTLDKIVHVACGLINISDSVVPFD
jgi:hypothetical protein